MTPSTPETASVAWVVEHRPERLRSLLAALDLDLPALVAVKRAFAADDLAGAAEALLDYYRACPSGSWLRRPPVPPGQAADPYADKLAQAVFRLPRRDMPLPRLASGHFDWGFIPPEPGGVEWVYGVNRHDYMADLLAAYLGTGNRAYARALDEHLRDWCLTVSAPEKPGHACPWGSILEAGQRAKTWPAVFYALQPEPALTPATRLLLLSQALDHARFIRRFHSHGSNWVITEMTGLLSLACSFPEFRDASEWRDVALRLAQDELARQVYPDGVQHELASNYQAAVLWHMGHFVQTVRGAGLTLGPRFLPLLERMWNYLACSLSPSGFAPHNGDSDHTRPMPDSQVLKPLDVLGPVLEAAEVYQRPDWTYIATQGHRGTPPAGAPTVLFPWAGQIIFRSGFDADALWAWFDIGPWGILHQHYDALHLSLAAYGRDLLVDAGRYTYEHYMGDPGSWRSYFVGSQSHNTLLVDGLGQLDGPRLAAQPTPADHCLISPDFDVAQGAFVHGYADAAHLAARLKAILHGQDLAAQAFPGQRTQGDIAHTRAVIHLPGRALLVIDHVDTDRPRRISPLWHFHPDCTVEADGQAVHSVDPGVGNLRIEPLGPIAWDLSLVRGQESPEFQGWHSTEMDVRLPNTCACYAATILGPTTFTWLLVPARGRVRPVSARCLPAPNKAVHVILEDPPPAPASADRTGATHAGPLEIAFRLDLAAAMRLTTGLPVTGRVAVVRL